VRAPLVHEKAMNVFLKAMDVLPRSKRCRCRRSIWAVGTPTRARLPVP